ncbi:MAG: hypothetical protein RR404_02570 [Bacilli bacterium]
MIETLVKMWKWFVEQWEPLFNFLREHRNSPILWIGLFLLGMLIFKLTYDVLNKGEK